MNILTSEVTCCPLCGETSSEVVVVNRDFGHETCDNDFTFVRCLGCTGLYLQNRPADSEIGRIYPAEYAAFNPAEGKRRSLVQTVRNVVQGLKFQKIGRRIGGDEAVLDFGCGSGELLKVIRERSGKERRLVGIDFSDTAASGLRAAGIEFWQGTLTDYPGNEGAFGAIFLNQVIEHMADPLAVLRKIHLLLRDGGLVSLETPAMGAWDSRLFPLKYWGGWHTPRHFVIFSETTLRRSLEKCGFEVLEVDYFFSPFLWANTLEFYFERELEKPGLAKLFRISSFPYLCFIGVVELIQKLFTRKTSNLRIVAKKIS